VGANDQPGRGRRRIYEIPYLSVPLSRTTKIRLVVGAASALASVSLAVAWEKSRAVSDFFFSHNFIRDTWASLNFPAYLAVVMFGHKLPLGTEWIIYGPIMLIQWFLTGYVLCALFFRRKEPVASIFSKDGLGNAQPKDG
jgi:hypothetical protein